ncbi:hypothetical protein T484DRAFT_1755037 [Baffinella frigidus]|nr:hypothetical protein T484DRAFT_1755037 [Cryptophyta sp. CCMP2293]
MADNSNPTGYRVPYRHWRGGGASTGEGVGAHNGDEPCFTDSAFNYNVERPSAPPLHELCALPTNPMWNRNIGQSKAPRGYYAEDCVPPTDPLVLRLMSDYEVDPGLMDVTFEDLVATLPPWQPDEGHVPPTNAMPDRLPSQDNVQPDFIDPTCNDFVEAPTPWPPADECVPPVEAGVPCVGVWEVPCVGGWKVTQWDKLVSEYDIYQGANAVEEDLDTGRFIEGITDDDLKLIPEKADDDLLVPKKTGVKTEPNIPCAHCTCMFSSKSNMTRHVMGVHTDKKSPVYQDWLANKNAVQSQREKKRRADPTDGYATKQQIRAKHNNNNNKKKNARHEDLGGHGGDVIDNCMASEMSCESP